ncbi:MAG TPA: hypothetical protein EYP41_18160 [Anaerolineae bacterium]|nr:hypothetical protein [Anaerolineae bacterium]HIP72283.1 hypothetical protein [Anaerolineae bacterium]
MKKDLVHRIVYLILVFIIPLALLGLINQANIHAANFVVTTTNDGGSGSLRQAVSAANQNPGPDTVTFALASNSHITLTYGTPADYIIITDTLTIDGGTAVSLTISGNNERNIFTIGAGTTVTITDLTLGYGQGRGGAIYNNGGHLTLLRNTFRQNDAGTTPGGAIFNKGGTVILQDSILQENISGYGAGIANDGHLEVSNTTFQNNSGNYGAGILNCKGGSVFITNSYFLNNSATYIGSAIYNRDSTLSLDGCGTENSPSIVNVSHTVFSGNYSGGAGTLLNEGEMNIEMSTIHNNTANHDGGGIANNGTLNLFSTTISSNEAVGNDGGAIQQFSGTITISNSIIENNTAFANGGAIAVQGGSAMIMNSSIVSNTAASAGSILNNGSLSINNSTISGNVAIGANTEDGGGAIKQLQATNNMTITHNTIANNTAPNQTGRDGIWQMDGNSLIQQSIVAGNGTANCTVAGGNWNGQIYNLADDASCPDFTEADPMLAPLGNYGGGTLTHVLLSGSPAVDAGDNMLCPENDQRGEPRPLDGNGDGTAVCDIGAVEINFWSKQVYLPTVMRE